MQAARTVFFTLLTAAALTPSSMSALEQSHALDLARAALVQEAERLGLTETDLADVAVTSSHVSEHNGVTHIYLKQRVNGIEVANATMTLSLDRAGSPLATGNRFVPGLATRVRPAGSIVEPAAAIRTVSSQLGFPLAEDPTLVTDIGGITREAVFESAAASLDAIPIELAYYSTDDGDVRLTWEMVLHQVDQKHWWQLWADAETGRILERSDWIDHDTYQVFPLPLESPSDGPRTVEANPADPTASPFGWHDTNGVAGAEFTDTRGNNVFAQEDTDANNAGGSRPDGGAGLDFAPVLDLATQQPADYQDAAIVNLFYWNNVVHDVLYAYGFDEAAGNFQENNYGNGGSASDSVNADAQDGSGTNNANFSTPPDGFNPRMQMFIWLAPPDLFVNSPAPIAGTYAAAGASFGAALDSIGITADLALADDGVGTTSDGCEPIGAGVSGRTAVIDRGNCEFGTKVLNAENAGAVAAIVVNNQGDGLVNMGPGDDGGSVNIPSLFIGQTDGGTIKGQLPAPGVNATMSISKLDRDSDLDNGVIAHEYCHGLSNRLTGGRFNTSCLSGNQQAGEGWSDICTLFFSASATDTAIDPHGIGTYVIFEPPDGNGIRPAPYSVDKNVNPLTYDDLVTAGQTGGVSIPHGVGTVFATAAWDLFWKLVTKHGFDPDLYGGTGGNNLWFQLIVDGLKMQPCNPTFLDARDAILAADVANNGGANQKEIWEAFARRGMGVSATDGGSSSSLAVGEAFDVPAAYCDTDLTIDNQTVSGWNEIDAQNSITVGTSAIFDATSTTTLNGGTVVSFEDDVSIDGALAVGSSPGPCT